MTKTCPECEGEGSLDIGTDLNPEWVVCSECDGSGEIEVDPPEAGEDDNDTA